MDFNSETKVSMMSTLELDSDSNLNCISNPHLYRIGLKHEYGVESGQLFEIKFEIWFEFEAEFVVGKSSDTEFAVSTLDWY